MRNFEDLVRERILSTTLGEASTHADASTIDRHDIEIFAGMLYGLIRAGARREGPEAFQEVFLHFADGERWQTSSEEELELVRAALLAAIDRFSQEAHALRVYFEAMELGGATESEATEKAIAVLGAT
ncbi:MAG: hypothetical protein Q8922_04650 [Bacteroidota bacterium]|nr:hypothetical protein [Bacteroidota bacterium]MDP4231871.1 hypothetical protein [Bacteroidota bacterium]MDP4242757.1 hypothetical protein [Bacteroidota bacterium]MDP4287208.1 hypothetical protein [Bacteroidota bacterium]